MRTSRTIKGLIVGHELLGKGAPVVCCTVPIIGVIDLMVRVFFLGFVQEVVSFLVSITFTVGTGTGNNLLSKTEDCKIRLRAVLVDDVVRSASGAKMTENHSEEIILFFDVYLQ